MKYKLVKIYPGSPDVDSIWYPIHGINNSVTGYSNREFGDHTGIVIHKSIVEHCPEFWQPEDEWMSKLTNSPKGSLHWLNTIGGRIAHIGEYMYVHPHDVSGEKCVGYGNSIEEGIREIMEYFKDKLK